MAKRVPASTAKPLSPRPRRRRALGPFSYLLLATIARLPEEYCFGSELEHHLSKQYGELIDLAQCYVTLSRLAEGGLIKGKERPSPTNAKYTVVAYQLTADGRDELAYSAQFYQMLAAAY